MSHVKNAVMPGKGKIPPPPHVPLLGSFLKTKKSNPPAPSYQAVS